MTHQQSTADERTASPTWGSDVSVTVIATPGDASCGIGTYGRDLRNALDALQPDESSTDSADREPGGDLGATTNGDVQRVSDGGTAASGGETSPTNRAAVTTATSDDPSTVSGAADATTADAGATTDSIELEQDDPSAAHFVSVALRAAVRGSDVVHVQHEYGLFRRPGSIYPGVLGLVFFPVLWLATRIRGQSIVVTMHSVLTPAPEEASFAKRLYLFVMHELIARVADHVIFLSEDCEERFHDHAAQEHDEYSVLPHGVNVADASSADRATAREYFGFDPADDVVAIPGFVRPPKGHDVFVEVAKELPDVEFLIAGGARPKGFDESFFRDLESTAPPNVTITGVLDDEEFPLALATPDLALLPYRVVTQSGTFNWCAAQELPVLASDQSYFRRIESEWGALETVPIDDVETIAARVSALLHDDERRGELSDSVRRYKEANSFETVAGHHLRIYRSLLGAVSLSAKDSESEDATPADARPQRLAACSAQREATATSD
ncbi:glycosyltransferase family 4 protein [Salinarchaeum laminariae]|uniref:glycosyltransferase family 4 protein n=1 Tax=Salinarchaeum laminariae TaxID=869888 RepID=UPI0020C017DD|nr:glycosyltransferase family 4 protein [Salinarchaeum laminariae]